MISFLRKVSRLILELLTAAWDYIKNHKFKFYVRKEVIIMTKNELEYQRLQLEEKLEKQKLAETERSNKARESETARANRMAEATKISPFYALAYSIWPNATDLAKAKANRSGPGNLANTLEAIYTSLSGRDLDVEIPKLQAKVRNNEELYAWLKDYVSKNPKENEKAKKFMDAIEEMVR